MVALERLDAADLRRLMATYRDVLRSHQQALNNLNVYPVPDGDTGTNMALTLESVVGELDGADPDLTAVCKAISHGSLMGARGNSGVILSQVMRGIAEVVATDEQAGGAVWAKALGRAADAAYGAVMRPVEGTILTVVRDAAEAAATAADGGAPLLGVIEAAETAATTSLARTPELLPVLAEAGVVDAGGQGYVLFLDAFLTVLDGRPLPEPTEDPGPRAVSAELAAHPPHQHGDAHSVSDLRYEVMYFLEAPDDAIPAFKNVWAGIGDSIVVVGGDGIWNCHIHTDDIGASVEAALDIGRPRDIRVTDLHEQVEEERWVREAGADARLGGDDAEPVATAVIAVATGDGIQRIFHSLGVQRIVAGGQSMNPSTGQLLSAVDAVRSDAVIILPNNKNIIPVAEQVDAETDKTVQVVPTTGVPEGFASLLAYDPAATIEDNVAGMVEAASAVVAGEVCQAVRDSSGSFGSVREGDWLGIGPAGICVVGDDVAAAALALLDDLVEDGHEIVTIIEGEGSTAAATRRLTEWLHDEHPGVQAELHHGGQPLYPYLFGVE